MKKEEFLKQNNIHLYDELIKKVDKDLREKGLESIYSSIALKLVNKKGKYVELSYDNVVWYSEKDIELLMKGNFINKEKEIEKDYIEISNVLYRPEFNAEKKLKKQAVKEKPNEEIQDLYIKNLIENNLDEEEAKEETIKQSMINELKKLQEEENKLAVKENRKPQRVTSSYFSDFIEWATDNKKEINIITLNLYHHLQVEKTQENYYKLLLASYELAKYLEAEGN